MAQQPADLACRRYLQRHGGPGLPSPPAGGTPWSRVLVIPAYRESASLVGRLQELPGDGGSTLVVLVLNRPDRDPDSEANTRLREAVSALPATRHPALYRLTDTSALYLHDLERLAGASPAARGVGLARKIGCDIALHWICAGVIRARWICCTDADACLPANYFDRLEALPASAVAATFPFQHVPTTGDRCNRATALYELYLHQYVLGLEYAGSPYAFHTLGSCLAVSCEGYARVRGFPPRAGAEDFYLLGKLAKIGPVARPGGACIAIESRESDRVPFGTGPAVAKIVAASLDTPLFHHPLCFEALRLVLAAVPDLRPEGDGDTYGALDAALRGRGMADALRRAAVGTLRAMALHQALAHCRRQGRTSAQFLRQFHQWFDGLRTLKFIRGMLAPGREPLSLAASLATAPDLWPACDRPGDIDSLGAAVRRHWQWTGYIPPSRSGNAPGSFAPEPR